MNAATLKRVLLFLSIAFIGVSSLFLVRSVYFSVLGSRSLNWPATNAELISSKVVSSTGARSRGKSYYLEIKYRYSVDGITYQSERFSFGNLTWATQRDAELELQKLLSGKSVRVHYHPTNPEISVVHPGLMSSVVLHVILSSVGTLVGLLLGYAWRKIEIIE